MVKIFLDVDGVMADFHKGVIDVTGKAPQDQQLKDMWKALARHGDFYNSLDKMSDADVLWNYVAHRQPTFLTGIPWGGWAPKQKREWLGRNYGFDVPVITCFASEKHTHAAAGDILIDDREKARAAWESVGGVFILHTSAADSIAQLKKMGL